MNKILLLAGIVLVVCLMNSKDLMKSVSSKSKSISKSLGVDSTTLLVVVFVGAVLFMCMNKSVEGFSVVKENENCPEGTADKMAKFEGASVKVCLNEKSEYEIVSKLLEDLLTVSKVGGGETPNTSATTAAPKVRPAPKVQPAPQVQPSP